MGEGIAELLTIDFSQLDDNGNQIKNIIKNSKIYVKEKSIFSNEFYQAAQNGFKAELKLEVFSYEYFNEKYILYKGKIYEIYRTYLKDSDILELYLKAYE